VIESPVIEERAEVESLVSRYPAAEALARIEHRFGVLPLLEAFFSPVFEEKLGSLGLFTPTPEMRWGSAAVEGESSGAGLRLNGRVRIASPLSEASIVLAPEHRLAWIDHAVRGVEKQGLWLTFQDAATDHVSRPVTVTELSRCLEAYAEVWALAAAICAGNGIRALRRVARTTGFSSSQLVAMDITGLEIAAELALLAARGPRNGLAVAAAAARILAAIDAKAAELRDLTGSEIDHSDLSAFLGGPLMIENEVMA
jgi:hypothetical protein